MALRVTNYNPRKGVAIPGAYAVRLLEKGPQVKELKTDLAARLDTTYTRHANNALTQVGAHLRKKAFPGTTGRSYPLVAVDGDGKKLDPMVTEYWESLSIPYVDRNPVSYGFWHKRGKLKSYYDDATARSANVNVKDNKERVRSHHKNRIRVSYTVSVLPNFHRAINNFVLTPFVTGDSGSARRVAGMNRGSLDIMAFPERGEGRIRRPFVAQLSAALGRRALTALRRL